MAVANGTCVSFCNQPKAPHNLATSRESKAQFGLPGYAPGTIAVNLHGWKEDSMLVKRMAAYTHLSSTVYEYIVRYWSEIATFSYPLAFNAHVGGVPIGIPGKSLVLKNRIMGLYQASEDSLTIG